ncbi:MAG: putative polymerase, sigma 70 family subunit [Myxococcales bacterium]|nr:putative polymerase, sigma 70 family subunit [Myxococcales bacterium]
MCNAPGSIDNAAWCAHVVWSIDEMADRKSKGTGKARADKTGKKSDVIDVGDSPDKETTDEDAHEEVEAEPDTEIDPDLVEAAAAIDVGDEATDEAEQREPPKSRGGSLARRDPLSAYMSETRRFPLLTPEEEHSLAVKLVEHGDTKAARSLIEANLRLVVKIAYEYRRAYKNLLDLVQEGNIGLIQAVGKFDPYRGVKLSSYAAFWIRAYMLKFILNNWRLVKIGTTQAQRKLFFNLRKEREKLEQLGFAPTSALLAEKLDVSEKDVIEMERRLAAPEASLDAPVGDADDGGARTRMDYLPSEDERPDRAVAQSEFSQLLKRKLEAFAQTLEGREQTIFRERWLTEEPLTLQELGDRYNVSRERARQLEKRMLDRLKKYLEAEMGTSVDIEALTRE